MLLRYQRGILIGFTLLIYSLQGYTNVQAVDQVITEQEGKTVIVPCPVNKDKCGELHSLNWFKGDNRIAAMLLDDSNVTSVADEFENRVSVEQNPFRLIIRNLQISDEDIYLCDTTYFIPIETCDNFNGHRVELNVLVPPKEVVILDEKGDRIENGSTIGPMQERQTLKATCIVKNTRPQPQVGWWRGNKRLTTHSPSYDEKDGLFTATLELSLQLSRDDLGHSIECRAESAAIQNTIKNHFSVDLQVRPISITINGVEHHTVQGSKVVLTCDVHGARPPVNLTWFNATEAVGPEENDITEIRTKAFEKEDGTYHTQSELIFNATRFENDISFKCQAENIVLQINREAPMQSSMTLEVMYPPVVKVSPPEITVNTSDTVLLNCEYVANPASLDHVIWYRNGDIVHVNDTERYEGGNSENVALVIRSTDKQDIGNYTCQLANTIGKGISEQQIDLDVQFVPIVEVLMIPEGPVKESDESNVTLFCNILDANPSVLTKVRWYANSTLLKELPDCEETREDLCHIDPSKLLLESIGRGFFYNYSCEGYNAAGWGPRSEDKELLVHYEPGPATLTHFPLIAVKKKSVAFSCSVDDPGYPESNRYRWMRGGRGPLQDIVTKDWTVEPVGLDSRTNYSCYAFNEGGKGVMATVNLEVHAPPFFIKNLPPYTGMLHTSRNANLTCRIECVPRCEISWLKDGAAIEKNDTRYFVKDKYMDASPATGDFESMLSVLHFNMSNWPNNKFDIEGDNANYTCVSTGNTVGPGIKSATYFSIEYAPDNTTVTEEVVYVQEETIPGRVICKSRANPEPTYEWRFNNKTVIRGNALIINTPMMRNDSGRYNCVAFNKHGRSTAETFIDVQFKPRCEIERKEIDDKDTLICTAFGNPEEADFSWSIKGENETVEWLGSGDSKPFKDKSHYILKEDYAIARTYRCVANNTAGAGTFCEIEVAEQLAWWQRWDETTLIIVVASILVLLLAVVIICCIIICICRRRRRQDKYRTDVSMSATHSVLSYQPNMPQVIPANTVLPDTLKVPIIANILMPALTAGHNQEKPSSILQTPPMTTVTTTTTSTTPILTKHIQTLATTLPLINNNTPKENVSNTNANNEIPNSTTTTTSAPITQTIYSSTNVATTPITTTTPATPSTTTSLSTTPTLSVRCSTQIPKSPPRWPLRPGVMVHVSSDTKENLAVNRMTLKPNATLANLTASTVNDSSVSSSTLNNSCATNSNNTTQTTLLNVTRQSSTLGRIGRQGKVQDDLAKSATKVEATNEHKQLPACQTLPGRGSRHTKLFHTINKGGNNNVENMEIPLDTTTSTEMENVVDMDKQQHANETERLTLKNETEIVVDIEAAHNPATISNQNLSEVEPLKLKKSHLARVEEFFSNLFFKRSSKSNTCRDSQRSHVGLLGGKFWKRSENTTAGPTPKSPFATEHRLKGIRSSGSVTYKKCAKSTTNSGSNTCSTVTTTTSTINNNNDDLCQTLAKTTTATVTQQQMPQAQTQQYQQQHQQQLPTTLPITPLHQQQHQQPLPHQSPVSTILMQPSLNINRPAPLELGEHATSGTNINTTTNNCTTVIQSIPSTIMSSREITRNPSMGSMRKGILKAPTPPPRPPPPQRGTATSVQTQCVKRTASLVSGQKIERVQTVQEKSSSMADPLTEPGEYENLPFHGLQTAPNKFTTPTTPTNFNNNTNVVRSVPRPKRLNGNISQTIASATNTQPATYYDEHETETQQQHQQQQQQYYQQQQQYNTMPYNRHQQPTTATTIASATLSGMQTLIPTNATSNSVNSSARTTEGGVIVHNNTNNINNTINNTMMMNQNTTSNSNSSTNPHQITYNLNNCFPKSYTEYYQNQQQQLQHPPQHPQQHPQQQHQFQQKFNNSPVTSSNSHMINAIEHDFSTYAVVERQQNPNAPHAASVATTNPFLAVSNFKKFDTTGDGAGVGGDGNLQNTGNYQTTSMKRQGKRKTFVDKLEDKRFYSLKFANNSNKHKQNNKSTTAAQALNLNHSFNGSGYHSAGGGGGGGGGVGVLSSLLSSTSNGKCKRHHSFAGGSLGDINPKGPVRNPTQLNFYDPPAYENVNDAVQVHSAYLSDMELPDPLAGQAQTATVLLHPLPYGTHNGLAGGSQGPKKKHHQRQHQPKEDLNLIEPERLSIYRSDSGISNSSYECVTPLPSAGSAHRATPPPGKAPRTPKTPKTPKQHKSQTLAHSAVTANFNSSHKKPAPRVPPTPLYMNLNNEQHQSSITNLERPCSPTSTMATSAYESASSSQNDNTCNDPISLSSSTSLYGGSSNKTLTASSTPQQRCNRHPQPTAEITTPEEFEQYQLGNHAHSSSSLSVASSVSASGSNAGAGRTKCKKQQRSAGAAIINHMELNKRPLATNPFLATKPAAATTAACHKKLHRRQTISDPYAHIKHINECRRETNNNGNVGDGSGINHNKTYNYCSKSANAFKAAAATTQQSGQSSKCSNFKSQQHQQQQQQQQISLQQYGYKNITQQQHQPSSSTLSPSSTSSCQQFTAHHQQQMLMLYEQQQQQHQQKYIVDNNSRNDIDDNGRPYNEVVVHGDEYVVDDNQSFNIPHMSLSCDVANNDDADDDNDDDVHVDNNDNVGEEENVTNVVLSHNQQKLRGADNIRLPMTITKPSITATSHLDTTTVAAATLYPDMAAATTLGYVVRPVKLPLRKYHSFHFQPTQTVAGQHLCKLQQLRMKQQQQQQHEQHHEQQSQFNLDLEQQQFQQQPQFIESNDFNCSLEQPYAKQGPLVFRPYTINENVTFKPIQPSEESEDSIDLVGEYVGTVKKFLKEEERYMDSGDFSNLTQRLKEQQDFLKTTNSPEATRSMNVSYDKENSKFYKEKVSSKQRDNNVEENVGFYEDLNSNNRNLPNKPETVNYTNSPKSPKVSTPLKTPKDTENLDSTQKLIRNCKNSFKSMELPNSPMSNKVYTAPKIDKINSTSEIYEDLNENPNFSREIPCFETILKSPKVSTLDKTQTHSQIYETIKEDHNTNPLMQNLNRNPRNLSEFPKSPNSPQASSLTNTPARFKPEAIYTDFQRKPRNLSTQMELANSPHSTNLSKFFTSSKTAKDLERNEVNEDLNSASPLEKEFIRSAQDFLNSPNSPKPSSLLRQHKKDAKNVFDEHLNRIADNDRKQQDFIKSPNSTSSPNNLRPSLDQKPSSSQATDEICRQNQDFTYLSKLSTPSFEPKTISSYKTTAGSPRLFKNSQIEKAGQEFSNLNQDLAQVSKLSTPSFAPKPLFSPKTINETTISSQNPEKEQVSKLSTLGKVITLPLTANKTESVLSEKDLEKIFRPYNPEKSVKLSDITQSPNEQTESLNTLQFYHKSPKRSVVERKNSFVKIEEKPKVSTALNPAASLEALEQLTKSNPQLWYTTQPGSRQNLHQLELFHTIQNEAKSQEVSKKQQNENDDEEDLGYSYCEDEIDDEEDEEVHEPATQIPPSSPNVTVIMAPDNQSENRVKYVLTQTHGEVHI